MPARWNRPQAIHPVLVHVLDEVGGGCGFRRGRCGSFNCIQLHWSFTSVGAVLQGVGFRDLGAQGVGHIGLRPRAKLRERLPEPNACSPSTSIGAITPTSYASLSFSMGLRHTSLVKSIISFSSVPPAAYSRDMKAHGNSP